jgi:hypothetical protein
MKKICIVCNKEFEVYDLNKVGKTTGKTGRKAKRGRNTINCSKRCSWIYTGLINKEKKEMKEIHNTRQKGGKEK